MVYLLETQLLENKSVYYGLTCIYGIGLKKSIMLCKQLGFSLNLKVEELTKIQITNLAILIENNNLVLVNDLKKLKTRTLKTLISIKSYKGLRQIQGFPCRGQRTHTNAKTAKKRLKRKII